MGGNKKLPQFDVTESSTREFLYSSFSMNILIHNVCLLDKSGLTYYPRDWKRSSAYKNVQIFSAVCELRIKNG